MSNVQQKYSTTASNNTKLGKLDLRENQTRFRDINDLFRQLMADIRQESNEARSLISTASSRAASAEAAVTGVRGEVNEANARINTFQTQLTNARQTAENAENRAEQAATSASSAASQAAQAASSLSSLQTTVSGLQTSTSSISNRVTALESASAENSGTSLVDNTTIEYLDGDLTAVDVAINEDLTDLASGRGQIGRTGIKAGTQESPLNLNSLVSDGWYAVGGTDVTGLPTDATSGILRVSSAYAEGSVVQCLWTGSASECHAFIRWSDGTNWSGWMEQASVSVLDSGQIGRTSIRESTEESPLDLDDLVSDGWYAVGGTGYTGLPDGVESGVCRVSSAYDAGSVVQCFWTGSDSDCRTFIRWSDGTGWSDWLEQMSISALGEGLEVEDGVVSVDFSNVLPEADEEDEGKVLSADGSWVVRVTPEELEAIEETLNQLAQGIADLNTSLEAVQATVAMEPDGTTIAVTDGSLSVPLYLGAAEEEDGIAGLVPPAEAADADKYLRGDGTWADPAMETSDFDGENAGLVPAPQEGEEGYLKSDGTWGDPCEDLEPRVEALEEALPEDLSGRLADAETTISLLSADNSRPQDYDWRTTSRAASVTCWPVNGSELEPTVWFSYTETLPEGTKGPENPSTIAGVTSVTVSVGASANDANATELEAEFGETYYGGHIDFVSGLVTVTHVAVEPGESLTVDISANPADSSQFEYVDTFGRTVTTTDGTDLVISGEDAGGLIVYKLATPQLAQVAGTQCPSAAWADKFTPRQNFLSSTGTEMQCSYAKSVVKTLAELEARVAALEA